jgi:hypothetical protein
MPENQENNVGTQVPFSEKHHRHIAPILGALIVILVLILGGLYLWGAMLAEEARTLEEAPPIINDEPETPRAEVDRQIMNTVSSSDDLGAIEADLVGTSLDSLDTELNTLTEELNQALE